MTKTKRRTQLRRPVIDQVAELLDASGRNEYDVIVGYTYRALAARVYDTDDPTVQQLSAVRRAVAKLVARGRVERHGRDPFGASWLVDLPRRQHERVHGDYVYPSLNPAGVTIVRKPNADDVATRPDLYARRPEATS